MAGNVLQDRQHTARFQPFRHRLCDRGDLAGLVAIGAVADHGIRTCDRHIRQGQTVDRDAEFRKIIGNQPGAEVTRPQALGRGLVIKAAEHRPTRVSRPFRRLQPLHPAAFLVHQHRRIAVADAFSQFRNERR